MRYPVYLLPLFIFPSLANAQTVLDLTGDAVNSTPPLVEFGANIADTLDDSFSYNPDDPTSSFPGLRFNTNNPNGYHADEPNNGDVTLIYTLDHTVAANELQIVVDLWGREGGSNAVLESRDDDFDVELFSGTTSLGKQVNQGIDADHHTRVDFGELPAGTTITRLVITARHTQTGTDASAPNRFTLMEIRAAALPTGSLTVTTLADEFDSPSGSDISLREAIRDARAGDTITFAPSLAGGSIQLNAALGELVIDKSLTIDASALANGIIIDGGSNGDFVKDNNETRCLVVDDDDEATFISVLLQNLTTQNGVVEEGETSDDGAGGNIQNRENLTLIDCGIHNGRTIGIFSSSDGGGIYSTGGHLELMRCSVTGNQVQSNKSDGGGIKVRLGNLTMTECVVSRNRGLGAGGGVSISAGELFMTHCVVTNNLIENDEREGGGISMVSSHSTLLFCTISENRTTASDSHGGGVFSSSGSLEMTDCTVSGNQTSGRLAFGAGVYLENRPGDEPYRLTRCTIVGNRADNSTGGGIFIGENNFDDGQTIIEHCTIVANSSASGRGAGVSCEPDATIEVVISHSIIQDNLLGDDVALLGSQNNAFTFSGENLIGTVGEGVTGITLNTDPILLAPLANYGGPTETRPPLPGSPAINAATGSTSNEDQRGFGIGGTPDIGAVEFQGENQELRLALQTDGDQDGLSVGVELFIGSDPFVTDFAHPGRPRMELLNGNPTLTLGRTVPPLVLGLEVQRSETLLPGSFTRPANILQGTNPNFGPTINIFAPPGDIEIEASEDQINISDLIGAPRAFYRLSVGLSDGED